MNPLQELQQLGQSVWLDYIRRALFASGELQRLVEDDGISGVTVNPTIFQKAVEGSADYDEALKRLVETESQLDAKGLYERLMIEDVQSTADALRPLYDRTDGADGYVSLEVSPYLVADTDGTIAEARRLWAAVGRPNLMIKVPASPGGIPAIEALTADAINVNITLMFSLSHYEAVAGAYIRGLRHLADPSRVASVASFFVSRVDTLVDRHLEAIGTPDALSLRGRAAIANAKIAYRRFRQIFDGEQFADLRRRGSRVQRPLWASTGTKNPAYSDVVYVEELIGPDTVTTIPPATLNAFRDHGRARLSLLEDWQEADTVRDRLAVLGIDLEDVGQELQAEGIAAFVTSSDHLLATLKTKRQAVLAQRLDRQRLRMGESEAAVDRRLHAWHTQRFACRLWEKDPTLWSTAEVPELGDRLGWLTLPDMMHEHLDDLTGFAQQIVEEGTRRVVLLGMGGSSLAPEVLARTFGPASGYPELVVLDSTHPDAVRAVEAGLDLRRTMFLVSSKSGTTVETLSLFHHFWHQLRDLTDQPGARFSAITDPHTPLARLAEEYRFRRLFTAPPDLGGRYSALSVFGLVPAALLGLNVHRLVDQAHTMAEASAFCVSAPQNPGLVLGAALGELGLAGRDKITLVAVPSLAAFPVWVEQLIAESTGKDGRGLIPVADEPVGPPRAYGSDRAFVYLRMDDGRATTLDDQVAALEAAGYPTIQIHVPEKTALGQEFFRWEVAVAAAGSALGIHPFNQPDVELAKDLTRKAIAGEKTGHQPDAETVSLEPRHSLARAVSVWLSQARPGDYVALQAYLAPTPEVDRALGDIRVQLRDQMHLATTAGYGPRFLHSTGQLHKGGINTGLFLQLIDEPKDDLPVPDADYTFGTLIRAQAWGDYQALQQRGRRVLRVALGRDVPGALAQLAEVLHG
jgi:transaldolase/glucose-6-phosphate isomerase